MQFLITLIILSSTYLLKAQTSFVEGFVITSELDSIKGFINEKDKKIYSSCTFKETLDSKTIYYNPNQLFGFRLLNGNYYVSRDVKIYGVDKKVFLEYLVKGKANIFYYRDNNDHYFIETESVDLMELTEKQVVVNNENGTFELPKRHKSKLKAVLADSPEIQPQIESVSLNHKSLIKLAVGYHYKVCDTDDCIVFERVEKKIKLNFSAFLGYGNYQIDLGTELKANKSSSVTFGGRMEVGQFLPWSERISAGVDLSFQYFNTEYFDILRGETIWFTLDGEEYRYVNDNFYDDAEDKVYADLTMLVLKLPISLYYSFGNGLVKPYFGVGLMNEYVISQNENFLYDRFSDVFGKTIPGYHFGFTGCLGIKFFVNQNHAIILEANYEQTANTNINKSLKLKNKVIGVKLGFQFK